MNLKIDILGTKYSIKYTTVDKDTKLKSCDGYCDTSTKNIVVLDMESIKTEDSLKDLNYYQRKVTRHEIIHAFIYESGLWCNTFSSNTWATNEEMTDWIAIQFSKIYKAFKDADCL